MGVLEQDSFHLFQFCFTTDEEAITHIGSVDEVGPTVVVY
jgi:hypothetical protein